MFKSEHSYADLFEGMLIGGSLVAMTTFLLGTKKGKELQKELSDRYHELMQKAEKLGHNVPIKKAPIKRAVKKVLPKVSSKRARTK